MKKLNPQHQKGATLLELLIAVSMGLFLTASILQILTQIKVNHRLEDSLSEVQENGRFALAEITSSLRYRGFTSCYRPDDNLNETEDSESEIYRHTITNYMLATNTPFDSFPVSALRGYSTNIAGTWSPSPTDTDILAVKNNTNFIIKPGSDIIAVAHVSRNFMPLSSSMVVETDDPVVAENSIGLEQDDYAFITNCDIAATFVVTNSPATSGSAIISHSTVSNNSGSFGNAFLEKSEIRKFYYHTYFIGDSGRTNQLGDTIHSLFRWQFGDVDPTEIVEGVEHMKILYGETLDNGTVRYISPDQHTIVMKNVNSIQVGILMQSTQNALTKEDTKTYELPGESIGINTDITHEQDKRLRKAFVTTVSLRNQS